MEDLAGAGTLLEGTGDLWVVERYKAKPILSTNCSFSHSWNADQSELTMKFEHSAAEATLKCRALSDGPQWQAHVTIKQGIMVAWRFPVAMEFDADAVREFVFPDHLGLAFKRPFFQPGGAGRTSHMLGGAGFRRITDDRCRMRPVQDEAVSVSAGKDAKAWLPAWYLREMASWKVNANRCPQGGKHDLSLVETEHGSWLSGYQLGGRGWLFRFGGMTSDATARPYTASVIATLARLFTETVREAGEEHRPDDDSSRSIAILSAPATGRAGTRRPSGPRRYGEQLSRLRWGRNSKMQIVELRSASELRNALAQPRKRFAVINTMSESFPAESAAMALSMLDAVRNYVRKGGIWWEAGGGYPFYRAIVPGDDAFIRSNNRAFCDIASLSSTNGTWTHYGIQPPDVSFIPRYSELALKNKPDGRTGCYTHVFDAYADPDKPAALPVQQMVFGKPLKSVLAEYARANGFRRSLVEKAGAELTEKLKRCILLKVTAHNLKKSARIAELLPHPVIFHSADYLFGGFDRQYPDHLPPRPFVGTPEDLTQLVKVCRAKGHLFMPYTNPTWWCVNPIAPTFKREGEAPLLRDLDGNLSPERYGSASQTQGYSICAWHPAVRRANTVIRKQFTEKYPVSVLFQDQIGARGHRWDTNPASPSPGAYLEGIHRLAQVDSAYVPLGTEDGIDRLINCETMFCGLSFPWLPNHPRKPRILYDDIWPRESWEFFPMALYLAHDKVLFYHHDLGGFVRDRLDLSITLVMGYGLSWWTHTDRPTQVESDWIDRLCRLQAAIGPECAGVALTGFEYLSPCVLRSRWEDLVITANLTTDPWRLDDTRTIAPEGFAAQSPTLEAGIFSRHPAKTGTDEVLWLIRTRSGTQWNTWKKGQEFMGR